MKVQHVRIPTATGPASPPTRAQVPAQAEPSPAAVPEESASVSQQPPAQEPEKDWTILFYLNGNNALSGQAVSTMRQLEYVGSDDKLNLVTQLARPKGLLDRFSGDWSGVRRYKVEHNGKELTPAVIIGDALTGWVPGKTKKIESPVVQDLGTEVNMGKARTLEGFVKWGMQNYPAKHYMVVMMGPSEGLSGMMHDVVHDSKIKVPQLGQALANVHAETGKKIDVLTINGSATNTMELAYEIKDHVKYLVGSQGIQAGGGMPLGMITNELKNANEEEGQDPLTMVRYLTLMNSMGSAGPQFSSTISAVDLEKMGPVKQTWDDLGKALLQAGVSGDKLRQLLEDTQDFQGQSKNQAYQNSRDAVHFAKLVQADAEITDPQVKAAAQAAITAIEDSLVGDAATGKYVKEANGMSIFGPTHYGYFRPDGTPVSARFTRDAEYGGTRFASDTSWDEVLGQAAKDSGFNRSLKKLGFSEGSIDKIHATTAQHKGKVTTPLAFGSFAGWLNGMNAWGGREASGFLFLNPTQAVYAGVAGAGYDALKAGQGLYNAATELKDIDQVVYAGFDVARAGAKAVANLGYIVPALKPVAGPAGMLMFFSPWIRDFYGVFTEYKQVRDGIELGGPSQAPLVEQWGQAAVRHFGNQQLWDNA